MKKFRTEIKWSVIFLILVILWILIQRSMGWQEAAVARHAIFTYDHSLFAVVIMILAIRDKRKNYFNGNINWLQAFVTGLVITFLISVLSPLAQYLLNSFIGINLKSWV